MKLKEAFKIRPTDETNETWMITIGNHLATEETFNSREEAEAEIDKTNWDLTAAFIYALKEADNYKETEVTNG